MRIAEKMGVSPSSTEGIKPIMGQGMAHRDRERQDGRTRAGRGSVAVGHCWNYCKASLLVMAQ